MSFGAIGVAGIGGAISLMQNASQQEQAKGIYNDAETERKKQEKLLNAQKREYKAFNFTNPFANMENTFEDLTVNQQQANFQAQQGNQQRSNIMNSMRGAAGGSGIAGLAQAMANQGQIQTQRISASIGQQESRNQALAAKGAAGIQQLERQGDEKVQNFNADRQATLLGMQMNETAGANAAVQQAQANQMNADIAGQQIFADMIGTVASGMASNPGAIGGETENIFTKMGPNGKPTSIFKKRT